MDIFASHHKLFIRPADLWNGRSLILHCRGTLTSSRKTSAPAIPSVKIEQPTDRSRPTPPDGLPDSLAPQCADQGVGNHLGEGPIVSITEITRNDIICAVLENGREQPFHPIWNHPSQIPVDHQTGLDLQSPGDLEDQAVGVGLPGYPVKRGDDFIPQIQPTAVLTP